jgi:hypothetical protein
MSCYTLLSTSQPATSAGARGNWVGVQLQPTGSFAGQPWLQLHVSSLFALKTPSTPARRRLARSNVTTKQGRRAVDLLETWLIAWARRQRDSSPLPPRLFTVGRLDVGTSGLVLVTNDGHWGNRVIHPSAGLTKVRSRPGPRGEPREHSRAAPGSARAAPHTTLCVAERDPCRRRGCRLRCWRGLAAVAACGDRNWQGAEGEVRAGAASVPTTWPCPISHRARVPRTRARRSTSPLWPRPPRSSSWPRCGAARWWRACCACRGLRRPCRRRGLRTARAAGAAGRPLPPSAAGRAVGAVASARAAARTAVAAPSCVSWCQRARSMRWGLGAGVRRGACRQQLGAEPGGSCQDLGGHAFVTVIEGYLLLASKQPR